jgi:CBS domain-containing protein
MLNTIGSILKEKRISKLISVAPLAFVIEAVRTMNDDNVGSVLVMNDQSVVGIFTERDVLVRVVGANRNPAITRVSEVMTTPVRSITITSTADDALRLMSEKHHRHLPVIENGKALGLVSMGDITRCYIRSQQEQVDTALRAVKEMAMSNRRGPPRAR